MYYYSTRDPLKTPYTSAQVIKMGIAPDGGLFVPETVPSVPYEFLTELSGMSYAQRAAKILHLFLDDYPYDGLLKDCEDAYNAASFPGGPAQLVPLDGGVYSLELWHGPTAAFKDMALQIMPRLLSRALGITGETRDAVILVATSGDTGKAALEGYRDVDRVRIIVFYPSDGVSTVQKLQMMTQPGDNVQVYGIHGNFDDAQTGVKKIFSDRSFNEILDREGFVLSSANSINWGRLVPQIVYYFSAYCDLLTAGSIKVGDPIDICVPTGNFGNILAAYFAYRMGLPVRKFVCASNSNNVLTDFFATGVYDRNRAFVQTISPSMDILISSNLERLVYLFAGQEKTVAYMKALKEDGAYRVDADTLEQIRRCFAGYCANEQETKNAIRALYDGQGYLCDTHTAVAYSAVLQYRADAAASGTDCTVPIVMASTASPYKFASDVLASVTDVSAFPADEVTGTRALTSLCNLSGKPIPAPLRDIEKRPVVFDSVIDVGDMPAAVLAFCRGQKL